MRIEKEMRGLAHRSAKGIQFARYQTLRLAEARFTLGLIFWKSGARLSVFAGEDVAEEAEIKLGIGLLEVGERRFGHQLQFVFGQALHRDAQIVMVTDVVAIIVDVPTREFAGANAARVQSRISRRGIALPMLRQLDQRVNRRPTDNHRNQPKLDRGVRSQSESNHEPRGYECRHD